MTRSGAGLAVLALGLVLGAGACGSHGPAGAAAPVGTPSAGASASANGRPADWRAWSACMRQHGVAMPDLDPRTGHPVDASARMPDKHAPGFGDAVQACAGLEPAGSGRNNQPLTPAELAQMRQWAACMRDNDVPVPD